MRREKQSSETRRRHVIGALTNRRLGGKKSSELVMEVPVTGNAALIETGATRERGMDGSTTDQQEIKL